MGPKANQTSDNTHESLYGVSVFGCTLSIINQTATVDPITKLLIDVNPPATATESRWYLWQPQQRSDANHWRWVQDPLIDSVRLCRTLPQMIQLPSGLSVGLGYVGLDRVFLHLRSSLCVLQ